MKKSLIALMALAACAAASAQTTLSVEYDFHKNTTWGTKGHYWATGITQGTKYGSFDAWLQGSHNRTNGSIDNLNGWELGYSYALPVGSLTITPRIAYGAMNNIDNGAGGRLNARYMLTTVEASHPISEGLSGFAGVSHTKGLNADAIQSWNRTTAGVDYSLTKNISVRVGGSYIRQLQTNQYGGYGIISYTLN